MSRQHAAAVTIGVIVSRSLVVSPASYFPAVQSAHHVLQFGDLEEIDQPHWSISLDTI
jgi:hypothetical protein